MLMQLTRTCFVGVSVCLDSFGGPAKQTLRNIFVWGIDEVGGLILRQEWRYDSFILGGRWGIILSVYHSTISCYQLSSCYGPDTLDMSVLSPFILSTALRGIHYGLHCTAKNRGSRRWRSCLRLTKQWMAELGFELLSVCLLPSAVPYPGCPLI